MKKSSLSLLALASLLVGSGRAQTQPQVTVLKTRGLSLTAEFVCANDPVGVTTTVQVFGQTTVERTLGPNQTTTTTPEATLLISRFDSNQNRVTLDASGISFDFGPVIDPSLKGGTLAGIVPIQINTGPGQGIEAASVSVALSAAPGPEERAKPFIGDVSVPGFRQHEVLFGTQRIATGGGSLTIFDPSTNEVFLSCPLVSAVDPSFTSVLMRQTDGTITITRY